MDIDGFCFNFPCMCCKCGDKWTIKPLNDTCPDSTLYMKICCAGTSKEDTLYWRCCDLEGEPPCECCKKCNIDSCPPPFTLMGLRVHFPTQTPDDNYVMLFEKDVISLGGKTCCEESEWYTPKNCLGLTYVDLRACIHPENFEELMDLWKSYGDGFYIETGYSANYQCRCPTK